MDTRVPIPVSVNPSTNQAGGIDTRRTDFAGGFEDKISQRMRDFEEECRQWRERFFRESRVGRNTSIGDRPRMSLDFPEFPSSDFHSLDFPSSSRFPTSGHRAGSNYKTFVEENMDGSRRYKIQFDINDFKPNELSVRTDGRILVVKGEKRIVQGSATETKQFNRELTLPDFVDNRYVTSYQQSDGSLVVEAPVILEKFRSIGHGSSAGYVTTSSPYDERVKWSSDRTRAIGDFHGSSSHTAIQPGYSPQTSSFTPQPPTQTFPASQKKYEFDLREYKPENISIKVDDNNLMTIHALRSDQDSSGKTYREFRREIELPCGIDTAAIRSCFSSDGILSIDLPDGAQGVAVGRSTLHTIPTSSPPVVLQERYKSGPREPLKLSYDLKGYLPTEVSVRVNDNMLEVKAKKNAESTMRTSSSYQHPQTMNETSHQSRDLASAEYVRKYKLPDWVNVDELKAHLDGDGMLKVEVPPRR